VNEAHGHPRGALCTALLALDRGDAQRAADLAERTLRAQLEDDRTGRAPWLEIAARARAEVGDQAGASTAARELRSIATAIGTIPLQASAEFVDGVVAAAAGDHDGARRRFEDATDLYARCEAPFETASTRIELAHSLLAAGRPDTATAEALVALEVLSDLGAVHEAGRAASLLRELGAPATTGGRSSPGPGRLTARQQEVLRLVAQGLSDKEIAARLGLSEHTVHRHMANILTRLGVNSRAAAVAHAMQLDVL
jgi:DNA-binding NarL/FixJ family response regulator